MKQFPRDMWSISSQDGCCTLTGCLFLALPSQERRYGSPPCNWRHSEGLCHLGMVETLKHRNELYKSVISCTLIWPTGDIQSVWTDFFPSDAIWWHRSGSTLAQLMAFCLMAPSHYLNQCQLVSSFGIHLRGISQEMFLISVLHWFDFQSD